MFKADIVKKINSNLEKILDDYIEILYMIKRENNDIVSLFFIKRRCLDLFILVNEIVQLLVELRNLYESTKIPLKDSQVFLNLLSEMED